MRERRKQERKTLVAYTQVFDLYGGILLGYLGDLTMSGAMIISERPMQPETETTISIALPELPDIKTVRMNLLARVAWCERDISPEFFNVGFEFKEVEPDQKKLIEAIIANYEFRRNLPDYPPRPDQKR